MSTSYSRWCAAHQVGGNGNLVRMGVSGQAIVAVLADQRRTPLERALVQVESTTQRGWFSRGVSLSLALGGRAVRPVSPF